MTLTSDAFIWTVRILLVVAVLWALLRWGKAAKPTVFSYLKRIVTLLVVSLLAVVNVAAPINAQNGWFVSWGDLGDFIAGGGMGGGPGGNSGSGAQITAWVKAHYKATTVGGVTVYDLTKATS